jgi:hypothetical protein
MAKDEILDDQEEISHKIKWGKVIYNNQGISIKTIFELNELIINWEDINFCSLTPSVKKTNNEWRDFRENKLKSLKFLEIRIALKNRHKILEGNFFLKIWYISILNLKALFGANDKPLPKKGVIRINVNLKSLSIERENFIEFLSKKSKFDLIVSF